MGAIKTKIEGAGFQGEYPIGETAHLDVNTIFPGMAQSSCSSSLMGDSGKPIMGFLFSVSRTEKGEYWPLYIGQNTIGRGVESSIVLREATVSEKHATLVVRKMQSQGKENGVFVYIQDVGSTYGTQLNGETLDFNPKECKNGDIITIGENYEMYFILIDPKSLGLFKKEKFMDAGSPSGKINFSGNPLKNKKESSDVSDQPSSAFSSRKGTFAGDL